MGKWLNLTMLPKSVFLLLERVYTEGEVGDRMRAHAYLYYGFKTVYEKAAKI